MTEKPASVLPLPRADVELLLEGSYPYVAGGVSSWTHRLIQCLPEITFGLTHIAPAPKDARQPKYQLPPNVVWLQNLYLHNPVFVETKQADVPSELYDLFAEILEFHRKIRGSPITEFRPLLARLTSPAVRKLFRAFFFSGGSFDILAKLYKERNPESSFIDYFWTWRFNHLPLFQLMQARTGNARVTHAISTGYAGFLGCLNKIIHGTPLLLTEHGIYTRERNIEITQANWIYSEDHPEHLLRADPGTFKRIWLSYFNMLGNWTYQLADRIITLFEGNRVAEIALGADPQKIEIIPNGIDLERFLDLRGPTPPAPLKIQVGFVGRIVPIKDVKTLVKAARIVLMQAPEATFHLIGPLDEHPEYVEEVRGLIADLQIQRSVLLHGRMDVREVYPRLDVMILTSLSEGQPLSMLEAMAAGVPSVATDVGCCRELVSGRTPEDRGLGECGIITSPRSPAQTAQAILAICRDPERFSQMARIGKIRARTFYQEKQIVDRYRRLYERHLEGAAPPASSASNAAPVNGKEG